MDEPLSPTLVPSSDSADAVDINGCQMGSEELIKIIDGLKIPLTIVKFDNYYSAVLQEGLGPNIFDLKIHGTHIDDVTKEEVIMWEKTTEDVDDIWSEDHAVTEPPSPTLILTNKSAGIIDSVV